MDELLLKKATHRALDVVYLLRKEKVGSYMKTTILKIDKDHIDMEMIKSAGKVISSGGLVAFPTETVYGLGGDAMDAGASEKIYGAKGRPSDNPLIVHIASAEALPDIARDIPQEAYILAEAFWPGPLTIILNKNERVPLSTTGGLETVAVRMPSHPIAKALIEASGTYIAAPSANTSGRPSPTMASHVIEDLDGKIDMIIDGGKVGIGIESTIVDLTGSEPMILRPGYITRQMLEKVLGSVAVDQAILSENADKNFHPKAPGMKYKHYAPKGDLAIVEGTQEQVVETINTLTLQAEEEGRTAAVIAADESAGLYTCAHVYSIGSRQDEETIASNLFAVLREMDELHADVIYSESYYDSGLGQAVMNRLLKAAGHHVIRAGQTK